MNWTKAALYAMHAIRAVAGWIGPILVFGPLTWAGRHRQQTFDARAVNDN